MIAVKQMLLIYTQGCLLTSDQHHCQWVVPELPGITFNYTIVTLDLYGVTVMQSFFFLPIISMFMLDLPEAYGLLLTSQPEHVLFYLIHKLFV